MEDEILLSDIRCEKCKYYFTAKWDEGRFYRCENEEAKSFVKEITPQFGCIFFKPLIN